ncbi:MAG: putative quinol monooxygenase [Verrucomicrobiales bacterium]
MNPEAIVSIHPYFKVHEGQLEAARALLPLLVEKTSSEEQCLYYNFTLREDEVFCREAYLGAAGVLAHLENIGEMLGKLLEISELTRLEVHGAADDLAKVKEPLAAFGPLWFEVQCGFHR